MDSTSQTNPLVIASRVSVNPVPATGASAKTTSARPRLDAVDWVRGLVMVIMALDHMRDYLAAGGFNPRDVGLAFPRPAANVQTARVWAWFAIDLFGMAVCDCAALPVMSVVRPGEANPARLVVELPLSDGMRVFHAFCVRITQVF